MRNDIPLPYYLQQHKISKNQLTIFTETSNTAEQIKTTMRPHQMSGSSITSKKPLMVITGAYPEIEEKTF